VTAEVAIGGGGVSFFQHWDELASVRARPRRLVTGGLNGALLFPPEHVPMLAHPLVQERAEVTDILLAHSLYQYMYFTTAVEQYTVIPVTTRFAREGSDCVLPTPMRRDAFKICTDEAWHAQFSFEFIEDMAQATGVAPIALGEPAFVDQAERIKAELEPSLRPLFDIVFAIVTETLISKYLYDIPRDERLHAPVRETVADHAADEGRHHAYFRAVLRHLWPTLDRRQRTELGAVVPRLIVAFLGPDLPAARRMLRAAGFAGPLADEVVGDCYRHTPLEAAQAAATTAAFRELGALSDPRVREAFEQEGLAG
jgi:P-aminobenzoate N-oxygenase AurF